MLAAAGADGAPDGAIAWWRMTAAGGEAHGLRPLTGGDGVTDATTRRGRHYMGMKESTDPASVFMYFDVDDAIAAGVSGPVYAMLRYFDAMPGGMIALEYDSDLGDALEARYRMSDDQWGGALYGGKKARTAVFLLEQPRFAGRQNLGADFRLGHAPLLVQSLALTRTPPPDVAALQQTRPPRLRRQARIGKGGNLIFGGFDSSSAESARTQTRLLDATLPLLKSMGATSHEGYVRWNLCEPEPGRYDWSIYDSYVERYRQHGMRWVPFLIVGSAYSLPDWFYRQPGFQGYVCLEHGEESDVASMWNPVLRDHLSRFIAAFCAHYGDSGIIESILLGITGNYGEAIFIATGNDWTASTHGEYHTHPGLWAGDPYAVADFRRHLREKYGDAAALNAAWGTTAADIGEVRPFQRADAPNDRAWMDFAEWYIGSMNAFTRFWLAEVRKNFPGDVEVCTGGHAPVEHGADFGMQCKLAAEFGAGVRITNEGSDYRANFSLTRWVASAGRQYGAPFSFEPAGAVDPNGVIARIYNATASGARGLHFYYPNVFGNDAARDNWVRWSRHFRQRAPRTEIAVYYPQTHIILHGNEFLPHAQRLRDYFDFGYRSDDQIAEGGLDDIGALILLWGNTSEAATWTAIADWVRRGGLLCYADGIGTLRTVEGDTAPHAALLGENADRGAGRVARFAGDADSADYRAFLARELAQAPELSKATRRMVAADGRDDHVYVTLSGPRELLWLNYSPRRVTRADKTLPPYSITATRIPRR